MTALVHDARPCSLGEGPLWHPTRRQLFWFDIIEKRLMTRTATGPQDWHFDEEVSAAGWMDDSTLFMASATGLWRFALTDGSRKLICPLEQKNSATRSNDGRADPWGGFWIGTMGRGAEKGAGAIYRYYQGRLRRLFGQITISNAICFAPNRSWAYFTDTATRRIMKVALDAHGWPSADPQVLVDLSAEGLNPDGAVVDADGVIWVALWGVARVAAYSPQGRFLRAVDLPADQVTCPAFGGEDFRTLFVTSATQGLSAAQREASSQQGMTFALPDIAGGLPEPRVLP